MVKPAYRDVTVKLPEELQRALLSVRATQALRADIFKKCSL